MMRSCPVPPWSVPPRDRRYLPAIFCASCLALFYLAANHVGPYSYAYPPSRVLEPIERQGDANEPGASTITLDDLRTRVERRLVEVEDAEILSYDASLELESKRCPTTERQSNRDQLNGEGKEWWPVVTVEELRQGRQRVIDRVRYALAEGELVDLVGDHRRGIVFTAGNKDTIDRLLVSIRILRSHGCQLPIEIWGFADELASVSASTRTEIARLGPVSWREVEVERVQGAWKQFQIKGEAIARSSFGEVLYLDSDNIVVTDPTYLFDSPLYKRFGAVLWPDFNRDSARNPIWRTLDVACSPSHWQAETGQLLIDKRSRKGLNGAVMQVVREMARESRFWFHMSGGDKDLFRFAFYFLRLEYAMAPHYPSSVGSLLPTTQVYKGHVFCGQTMLQYGLSGEDWENEAFRKVATAVTDQDRGAGAGSGSFDDNDDVSDRIQRHAPPLFMHMNLLKHSGYWNRRGSTFSTIKRPTDDRLDASSLASIRQTGLAIRGICSDVWDADAVDGAGEEFEQSGAVEGVYERGGIDVVRFDEAFDGVLRSFEDAYFDAGGKAGGW
ncbi:hypothetical protein JCM10212_004234 [Sporobolomyces blumeae]